MEINSEQFRWSGDGRREETGRTTEKVAFQAALEAYVGCLDKGAQDAAGGSHGVCKGPEAGRGGLTS